MHKPLLLSIIVTSYTTKRLQDILDLLSSIDKQNYGNIEVIIVLEKSKLLYDRINQFVTSGYFNKPVRVLLNNGENGASFCRNMGIRIANGEIISIVDDDVMLPPIWAQEVVKTFLLNESFIGVTGPAFPLWEDETLAWLPEEFHWIISCTSWCQLKEITDVRNIWLENASFKREAFDLCGLLNPQLGPQDSIAGFKGRELGKGTISEEVEFSCRLRQKTGKRIVYNPHVQVWHKVHPDRLTWRYIVRWSYWTGLSKKMLEAYFSQSNQENNYTQEQNLLKRIFTSFYPRLIKNIAANPSNSIRGLFASFIILASIAIGQLDGSLQLARARMDWK
jgi:glycosyltransferase involved in cell wall biosynthesis